MQTTTSKGETLLRGLALLEGWRRGTMSALLVMDASYKPAAYHSQLSAICDQVAKATLERTLLSIAANAPPRTGKTTHLGYGQVLHTAALHHDANLPCEILYVTASADLAKRASLKVRKAIELIYSLTGIEYFAPSDEWTSLVWETKGGFRWMARGWNSGTGGIGAHQLLMDDLYGSRRAYRSKSVREEIPEVVQEDLLSRRMGGAALQLETRRGVQDVTGWLTSEYPDTWKHYSWKMLHDGKYLWPERFGEEWHRGMPHLSPNSTIWRSLYQQEPVSDDAYLIEGDWIPYYSEHIDHICSTADRLVVGADLATSGKTTADPCAFVAVAFHGAKVYLVYASQARLSFPNQLEAITELHNKLTFYNPSTGNKVPLFIRVEQPAGGQQLVDVLRSRITGIEAVPVRGDKVSRLTPHLPMIAAQQFLMPDPSLNPKFRDFEEVVLSYTGSASDSDHFIDALTLSLSDNIGAVKKKSASKLLSALQRTW